MSLELSDSTLAALNEFLLEQSAEQRQTLQAAQEGDLDNFKPHENWVQ